MINLLHEKIFLKYHSLSILSINKKTPAQAPCGQPYNMDIMNDLQRL